MGYLLFAKPALELCFISYKVFFRDSKKGQSPMPRLTDRSKQILEESMRESMRNAMISLLSEKSIVDITMAEIAKKVKVSSVTVYNYYPTRQELIRDTFRVSRMQLFSKLSETAAGSGGPEKKLEAFARTIFEDFESNRYLFMARFSSPPTDRESKSEAKKQFAGLVDIIAKEIRAGIKSGAFRKVEPEAAAVMMLGAVMGLNRHCLFGWIDMDINEKIKSFHEFILGGLKKHAQKKNQLNTELQNGQNTSKRRG